MLEDPLDGVSPDEEVSPEDDPPLLGAEAGVLQIATGGTAGGVVVVGVLSPCAAAGKATASAVIAVATAAHL